MHAQSLQLCLFATLWTVAQQAPLFMAFSKQQYWSGLPCPPPGDLPDPGLKPVSPALHVESLPLFHHFEVIVDSLAIVKKNTERSHACMLTCFSHF